MIVQNVPHDIIGEFCVSLDVFVCLGQPLFDDMTVIFGCFEGKKNCYLMFFAFFSVISKMGTESHVLNKQESG